MKRKMIAQLKSNDMLERCDAIEYLSKYSYEPNILKLLIKMIDDKNYLVRCEAYDTFYGYKDVKILDKLCNKLRKEKSKSARMHLCSTLCSIIKQIGYTEQQYDCIKNCYLREKEINVMLSFWCIFYLIEKDGRYIKKILLCLNDEDYHIRCNVVNLLSDIEDDYVKMCEKDAYISQLEKEDSEAVRALLNAALKTL